MGTAKHLKRRSISTRLHCDISQKAIPFLEIIHLFKLIKTRRFRDWNLSPFIRKTYCVGLSTSSN
jgi:hypothetical protein